MVDIAEKVFTCGFKYCLSVCGRYTEVGAMAQPAGLIARKSSLTELDVAALPAPTTRVRSASRRSGSSWNGSFWVEKYLRSKEMWSAVIQMQTTIDPGANCDRVHRLVAETAGRGARLVAPARVFLGLWSPTAIVAQSQNLYGPLVQAFRDQARQLRTDLLLGTTPERAAAAGRVYNTSVLSQCKLGSKRPIKAKFKIFLRISDN
jgi:hypothetical protein